MQPRKWLPASMAAVTLVALIVRIPLFGEGFAASDTTHYLEVAHSIFHGGFLDNLRPPGYSMLLAAFELAGVDPVTGVVQLQNLVGVCLPAAVLAIGWRFFGPGAGVLAGFLTAASPLMIITEQFALADYLFGVLILAGAAVLAEAVLRIRLEQTPWRLLIVAGVLFGVATLFRANGLLGLVAIPTAIAIGARGWRSTLRAAAVAVGAMILVLSPWMLHNLIRFGDPSVATEGGISLYARAVSYDKVPPAGDTPDSRIALRVYRTADFTQVHGELQTTVGVYNALSATGKDPAEASASMGVIAREAILREPGVYLENTWKILGLYRSFYDPRTFTADQYLDQIITTRNYFRRLAPSAAELPGDSDLTRGPWQLAQSLTKLIYLLTLGGAAALLLPFLGSVRSRLAATVLLVVSLMAFLGGSLTAVFSPRYDVMFAPLVWLLASAAVSLLVNLLVAAVRERPWGSSRTQLVR
jgi:4-amino-4-deoxy-L-arabinose transferase-like glycosyltransferase